METHIPPTPLTNEQRWEIIEKILKAVADVPFCEADALLTQSKVALKFFCATPISQMPTYHSTLELLRADQDIF